MASVCMASPSPGNTKQEKPKIGKAKNWQFTLNEVDKYEELKAYITGLKSNNYFISCKEIAPSTKHEHIHIYAQFTNCILPSIKKSCGAHIEACKGSPQQNINYIKKDGNIIDEIGNVRLSGNPTIREIENMSREEIKDLPWQIRNTAIKIKDEQELDISLDDIFKPNMKVYWITGPSGAGKSHKAFKMASDLGFEKINIVKYDGSFWHGIGLCKIAIYDDFRDSHMKPSEFINFIDYNVHPLNIKGGSKLNKYEVIIITSVQNPHWIYQGINDIEPHKQWLRRMTIIELDETR